MPSPNAIDVNVVEYLAATAMRSPDFGALVTMTIRMEEDSWAPVNIGLRREQAERLRDRLNELFENIPDLQPEPETPQPKPRRRRKKKS